MNTLILDFLNSYADNTNPQYAVMLKGKWGCGKTHLIKEWKKRLERRTSKIGTSSRCFFLYDKSVILISNGRNIRLYIVLPVFLLEGHKCLMWYKFFLSCYHNMSFFWLLILFISE